MTPAEARLLLVAFLLLVAAVGVMAVLAYRRRDEEDDDDDLIGGRPPARRPVRVIGVSQRVRAGDDWPGISAVVVFDRFVPNRPGALDLSLPCGRVVGLGLLRHEPPGSPAAGAGEPTDRLLARWEPVLTGLSPDDLIGLRGVVRDFGP